MISLSCKRRLDNALLSARTVMVGATSKLVLMSDCHRGCGNWSDDFARNKTIFCAALEHYYAQGYTYIEIGDGDELWKNKRFEEIASVHWNVFALMRSFYLDNRLYLLYGNHDIVKRKHPRMLDKIFDSAANKERPLFPGLPVEEGLALKLEGTEHVSYLVHGHQADFFNDTLWPLARVLVRHVWNPLELIGFSDPSSAARNNKVKEKVERRLEEWAEEQKRVLIAGHTHRPVFPEPGEGRYFNDGSSVHPWSITAIEVQQDTIALVKWEQKTHTDGTVYIGKEIIAGPSMLADYFK